MTVRAYRRTDFPSIVAVYADSKLDELQFEGKHFELTPLDKDPAILAAFEESDVLVYDEGSVLGFAATFSGQLRALFVHSKTRGRGVGGALLGRVIADIKGPISLNVAASNSRARAFYEASGFVQTGLTSRRYSGIDVVYAQMTRSGL